MAIYRYQNDLPEGLTLGPVVAIDTETMGHHGCVGEHQSIWRRYQHFVRLHGPARSAARQDQRYP